MRTIQDELGDGGRRRTWTRLREKAEAEELAQGGGQNSSRRSCSKLERLNPAVAEYSVQVNLPAADGSNCRGSDCTTDNLDLEPARRSGSTSDHFGLEEVKERIAGTPGRASSSRAT